MDELLTLEIMDNNHFHFILYKAIVYISIDKIIGINKIKINIIIYNKFFNNILDVNIRKKHFINI